MFVEKIPTGPKQQPWEETCFMFVFNSSPHRYQLNPSCLVVISLRLRIQVSTEYYRLENILASYN